jgi:CheY-like chemotaxis protein
MNSKILIVEDEARLREVLSDYFGSKGELPTEASK